MKKSLIALAVASAFVAPAAMAEVTLSGAINVGITYLKSGAGSAGGTSQSSTSLANNYSHIDIESVDDIGGGNKVIMHYQMQANPGSLGDTPTNRNSFIGLTGTWGSFRAGTNENVYERFMYESDPLDGAAGLGGNIQMLGHSGFQGHSWFGVGNTAGDQFWRRTDNTLMYYSPDMSGFTFEIEQTLSAHKTIATPTVPSTNPTITSLGVQFKPAEAPFFANAAYEKHKDTCNSLCGGVPGVIVGGDTSPKSDAWQIGGGYTIADLTLYARYEGITYKGTRIGGEDKVEVTHWWVAGKYNVPTGYFGAEFGLAPKLKANGSSVDGTGAKMYSVGYFHNLSKQSQLQFMATHISNDKNVDYGIGAGAGTVDNLGANYTGVTVGLKHTF